MGAGDRAYGAPSWASRTVPLLARGEVARSSWAEGGSAGQAGLVVAWASARGKRSGGPARKRKREGSWAAVREEEKGFGPGEWKRIFYL